jgi:hypothetical protein
MPDLRIRGVWNSRPQLLFVAVGMVLFDLVSPDPGDRVVLDGEISYPS